jgi:ATP-dependent Clp protease ATP-binding subunit ClpB
MTSNLGSEFLLEGNTKENRDRVNELLKSKFKPEFLNRIDEIITFNSLGEDVIGKIVVKFLNQLKSNLLHKGIILDWDEKVVEQIAKDSYDPAFGARPIRRFIQKNIETPLANKIVDGTILNKCTIALGGDNSYMFIDE